MGTKRTKGDRITASNNSNADKTYMNNAARYNQFLVSYICVSASSFSKSFSANFAYINALKILS